MNETLLKSALLGVDQEVSFELDGPIGVLLSRVTDSDDAALNLGRHVGVFAACSLAATTLDTSEVKLPTPAATDPHSLASTHSWASAITSVFSDGQLNQNYDARLKHDACTRLAHIGATLPWALLPQALDAGQRNQTLRAVLQPVLGHRGRWLAEQNADWKFASGVGGVSEDVSETRVWQEGNHLERLAHFDRSRHRDPDAARELLKAGLGDMPAKERLDFVTALGKHLAASDAPLLDSLLRDRSRDVRYASARLLAKLPDAQHAQRLIGWVAPLLSPKRGLLGKSWQLEAPERADPAWAGAAIETARPQYEALGERAWWLFQLVRQVPLSWWTTHTGMGAADLVAWAGKTDWKDALHRAWRERVSSTEPEWVEALLSVRTRETRAAANELLALLPVAQREKHWPDRIDSLWKDGAAGDVIASCAPGETLSGPFSKALVASMLTCFEQDHLRHDYGLRACLLELATLVHPEALRNVRSVPRRVDETPAMAECAEAFERILRVRTVLHTQP